MILAFLLAAAAGMLFASSSLFDKTVRTARTSRNGTVNETLLVATDKATVLIMGVDERDDDIGRSDTLMLAAVDPKKQQASLFSIPRDTRVLMSEGYYEKINSAYSIGGWKKTRDVVEDLLDTPVDHYVLINTRAFPRIIDAIGGVDIDVEKRMEYVDEWDDAVPGGLVIDLYPGMQHMNGVTAMSYVRYRDEEGDIGRIERQQKFMKAVMAQVTSPAILTQLPSIIRECMNSVQTDLSFRQLLELAGALKEAQSNGLKTEMLAGKPMYIDEISYWIPDIREARLQTASMLGITMSEAARAEMEREMNEYEASIPSNAVEADDDTDNVRTPKRGDTGTLGLSGGRQAPSRDGNGKGKGKDTERDTDTARTPVTRPSSDSLRPSGTGTSDTSARPRTEDDDEDDDRTRGTARSDSERESTRRGTGEPSRDAADDAPDTADTARGDTADDDAEDRSTGAASAQPSMTMNTGRKGM